MSIRVYYLTFTDFFYIFGTSLRFLALLYFLENIFHVCFKELTPLNLLMHVHHRDPKMKTSDAITRHTTH